MKFCDHLVTGKLFNTEIYLCKLHNYDVIYKGYTECSEECKLSCYTDIRQQRKDKLKKINYENRDL